MSYIRHLIIIFSINLIFNNTYAQYFQQHIDYQIEANLDTSTHKLTSSVQLTYHNLSPDALDTIYFHFWANAFSSHESAFAKQRIHTRQTDFYFADQQEMGGYEDIKLQGGQLIFDEDNSDMAYVILDETLLPRERVLLELVYTLKIPKTFSRMGRNEAAYHMAFWYPKPAVYDKSGWHWFPYLDYGEFYSEYGSYQVVLEVPENYTVAATGTGIYTEKNGRRTYKFIADKVIDFAWYASPHYNIIKNKYTSISGDEIDLSIYTTTNDLWQKKAMPFLQKSIAYYEREIGPYPYPQLSIVNGCEHCDAGMEYPMIVEVSAKTERALDYYINHEVGHQWFYGILGFNEREEPFMDEGLTTYYEHKYTEANYNLGYHAFNLPDYIVDQMEFSPMMYAYVLQKRRKFSESPSDDPSSTSFLNYGLNSYERAAYAFAYLAAYIGEEEFAKAIQTYYQKWKFRHPHLEDLIQTLEDISDNDLSWFSTLLSEDVNIDFALSRSNNKYYVTNNGDFSLPYEVDGQWYDPVKPGTRREVPISNDKSAVNGSFLGFDNNYNDNNLENGIGFSFTLDRDHSRKKEVIGFPTLAYNHADGFQLGMAFFNFTYPVKNFSYMIQPAYAFASKELVGNAWFAYNIFNNSGAFRKIQMRISTKRFSDYYSDNNNYRTQYLRLTPQLSLHLRRDPVDLNYTKFTARTILLNQERAFFRSAEEFTIENQWNPIFQIRMDHYYMHPANWKEAMISMEYQPYKDAFGEKQSYLKATGFYKYSLGFAPKKKFGFRLFGSYFISNSRRQSSNFNDVLTKGSIALLHQGFNDYQYEDYYLNRQGNAGPLTNQVSYAGGGFKDALGPQYGIGISNDLAVSINAYTDLPFPLPDFFKLKPFIDIGYYRTKSTLNDPLTGKTLFSGGLMLSYLDGGFEIYIPIFASEAISNIYAENNEKIWNRISFSIDLHRLNPWDLEEDLNF